MGLLLQVARALRSLDLVFVRSSMHVYGIGGGGEDLSNLHVSTSTGALRKLARIRTNTDA